MSDRSEQPRLGDAGAGDRLVLLARMWLREGTAPGPDVGRIIRLYERWCQRAGVCPLPMTDELLRRHLAWVTHVHSRRTAEAARFHLDEFRDWLYEPLLEAHQ